MFKRFVRCEAGATAIEYGLIAALIAVSIIFGAGSAGQAINDLWGSNTGSIQTGLNAG